MMAKNKVIKFTRKPKITIRYRYTQVTGTVDHNAGNDIRNSDQFWNNKGQNEKKALKFFNLLLCFQKGESLSTHGNWFEFRGTLSFPGALKKTSKFSCQPFSVSYILTQHNVTIPVHKWITLSCHFV